MQAILVISAVSLVPGSPDLVRRRTAITGAAAAAVAPLLPPPVLAAPTVDQLDKGVGLSVTQIEGKLQKLPLVALVNGDDQPFFTSSDGGRQVGYFYLDPNDALLDYRQFLKTQPDAKLKVISVPDVYFPFVVNDKVDVGGSLRLRPSRRQIVWANRALQYNSPPGTMVPKTLSEEKGQVPVFYSEKVAFEIGGDMRYPFFLRKEDLDRAFDALLEKGLLQGGEAGGTLAKKSKNGEGTGGMPVGLVRVATLDGLVKQMRTGEIDLSKSIVVGSDDAVRLCAQLLKDGSALGALP